MIKWLADRLLKKSEDRGTALTKYYILRSDKFGFGIKLHHILRSDEEYHTHPWNGFSIIFGGYWETFKDQNKVRAHGETMWGYHRFLFNMVKAERPHKIIVNQPVWTLFFHGKRINADWYYGNMRQPWRGPNEDNI